MPPSIISEQSFIPTLHCWTINIKESEVMNVVVATKWKFKLQEHYIVLRSDIFAIIHVHPLISVSKSYKQSTMNRLNCSLSTSRPPMSVHSIERLMKTACAWWQWSSTTNTSGLVVLHKATTFHRRLEAVMNSLPQTLMFCLVPGTGTLE